MSRFNGMQTNDTVLGVPLALWYREWRAHRGQYVAAAMLLVIPWFIKVAQAFNPRTAYTHLYVTGVLHGLDSRNGEITWDFVIAALLGASLMWSDRWRGTLGHILEGPVSRQALIRAKVGMLGLVMVVGAIVEWAILGWAAITIHYGAFSGVSTHVLYQALIELALSVTALGFGTAMGSLIFVLMASFGLYALPTAIASLAASLAYPSPSAPPIPWLMAIYRVAYESPPFSATFPNGWGLMMASLGLVIWMIVWSRLVNIWWPRVSWERLEEPLYFPFLWNFFYAGLAFVSGFVAVWVLQSGRPAQPQWLIYTVWGVSGFIEWFFWRWLVSWIGRGSIAWGPGVAQRK